MRHYGSFLVRWWHTEQQQRLSIRHVQSGEELTVEALAEALAWMAARVDDDNRAPPRSPPGNITAPTPETSREQPKEAEQRS
jgi:hypothetical protein